MIKSQHGLFENNSYQRNLIFCFKREILLTSREEAADMLSRC